MEEKNRKIRPWLLMQLLVIEFLPILESDKVALAITRSSMVRLLELPLSLPGSSGIHQEIYGQNCPSVYKALFLFLIFLPRIISP